MAKPKTTPDDVAVAAANVQRTARIMEAQFKNLEAMDARLGRRISKLDEDLGSVFEEIFNRLAELEKK